MTLVRDIAILYIPAAFAIMSAFLNETNPSVCLKSYLTLSVHHVAGLWDMNTRNSLRSAGSYCRCCGDVGTDTVVFRIKH